MAANQQGQTHDDFKALSDEYQHVMKTLRKENDRHAGGKSLVLCFEPRKKVFHISKLLVPNVQIGIQMYFNSLDVWTVRFHGAVAFRLDAADIKVKLYLCQLRLNPSVYTELMSDISSGMRVVSYPTVRSEIRTHSIQRNNLHYEITNPFQNRLPNMVVIGMASSTAFNGDVGQCPFSLKLST